MPDSDINIIVVLFFAFQAIRTLLLSFSLEQSSIQSPKQLFLGEIYQKMGIWDLKQMRKVKR